MLFSVLLSLQACLSSVYPWFSFSFLSLFLLVWQFMVMNLKQTKIKFQPQIKLNHYIPSVNSTCTQHTPPGVRGGGGIWPPCQSGGGAFANFALPEARAFANPRGYSRAFDMHAVSYQNITTQRVLLEKKQIGSSVKERNKLKRVVKACFWSYMLFFIAYQAKIA